MNKQINWRKRAWVLVRLKGSLAGLRMEDVCTKEECDKINEAQSLVQEVIDNFTKNSISLGYKAKKRCKYCGKPLVHNECVNRGCINCSDNS